MANAASAPPFELRRPELNAQLPTLLDHAAVSLRHPARRAVAAIAAASVAGFRADARRRGLHRDLHTRRSSPPRPRAAPTCSRIDWFGRRAYLAQSPQFYKQMMVGVFERVYEVGPVFRAEPHDTVRHLAEYVSLDAEIGFIHDHRDVMAVLRDVLAGMVERHRASARRARSTLLELSLPDVPADIPVVDFAEAQAMIERATGEPVVGEPDLAPARRAVAGGVGRARARLRLPVRERLPDGEAAVLHAPRPGPSRRSRTASTCSSAVSSSSPAGSGCTATTTTSRARRPATSRRSTATSRRSATACRRTAVSPSASNAGSPA